MHTQGYEREAGWFNISCVKTCGLFPPFKQTNVLTAAACIHVFVPESILASYNHLYSSAVISKKLLINSGNLKCLIIRYASLLILSRNF